MTVQQLIQVLGAMTSDASALLEGDVGCSPLGGAQLVSNGGGLPEGPRWRRALTAYRATQVQGLSENEALHQRTLTVAPALRSHLGIH